MPQSRPVAIVTGAGAGIGRAITTILSENGYTVAAVDIDQDRLDSLQLPNVHPVNADVSDPKQVKNAINQIESRLALPVACINNAGVISRTSILETSPTQFQKVLQTNLGGCFHFTHYLAAKWVEAQTQGHIVNVSSGHAIIGGYDRAAYAASKAAIEALTRNSAVELGQYGILVNAVAPGFTFTEMSRQSLVGERLAMVNRRLPIRRVAEAEEVATAVLSLITGKIPYMTGQTLRIDGGWSNSDVDYSRLQPESPNLAKDDE